MQIGTLEQLIKARRSIRRWKKDEVPDSLITKAIELATWAPNGGNFQGWRFVVVKNREVIEKMADAVQSVSDKVASWPEAKQWQEDMDRYRRSNFRNAPACVGVFVGEYQSPIDRVLVKREPVDPEAKEILASRRSAPTALQSAAAAVTTMLLAFHQMGLGGLWMASPLQAKKEIERLLKAPSNLSLVCVVAVGYPDEAPQKDRKPVDEVLEFVR